MTRVLASAFLVALLVLPARSAEPVPAQKVAVGTLAPAFQIKDASGQTVVVGRSTLLSRGTAGG